MPTFSIITPCFNKAQFLAETLDSVLNQTCHDWECIIIDDGSTDNTKQIADMYTGKDCRFKYIYQTNQGVSAARNNAIKASSGQYILPLDADDKIDATYLEKALKQFAAVPNTKLVYCLTIQFGDTEGSYYYPKYSYKNLIWNNTFHNSCIYRRSDFNMTKGYNTEMRLGYEDYDFWLSLIKPEDIVYCINEPLYHYRITKNSRNAEAFKHRESLLIQIYHNHEDIYAPYVERIIIDHQRFEFEHNHAMEIYNTTAYKLGYAILKPLVAVRDFFFKHCHK